MTVVLFLLSGQPPWGVSWCMPICQALNTTCFCPTCQHHCCLTFGFLPIQKARNDISVWFDFTFWRYVNLIIYFKPHASNSYLVQFIINCKIVGWLCDGVCHGHFPCLHSGIASGDSVRRYWADGWGIYIILWKNSYIPPMRGILCETMVIQCLLSLSGKNCCFCFSQTNYCSEFHHWAS